MSSGKSNDRQRSLVLLGGAHLKPTARRFTQAIAICRCPRCKGQTMFFRSSQGLRSIRLPTRPHGITDAGERCAAARMA